MLDTWNLKTKKILVIDDFPEMISMMRQILFSFSARQIFEAKTGDDGLRILENETIDIVLCDYNLGKGKNGQQVLEEAKHKNILPYSSIFIMITAENTTRMVMAAVEILPDEYLSKPFTKALLQSRIKRLMQKKENLKQVGRAIQMKKYNEALILCDGLLESDIKNRMEILKLKGELFINIGNYSDAQNLYAKLLKERYIPWAGLGIGQIHFYSQNYNKAIQVFEELIDRTPAYTVAYDWLAKSLEKKGELSESQKILEKAVEKSPNSILRQRKLGEIALKNSSLKISESAYKKAIDVGKYSCFKSPMDYAGLSKNLIEQGSHSEALKVASGLEKEFKEDLEAEFQQNLLQGVIYNKIGNNEQCEKSLSTAIQLFQQRPGNVSSEAALDLANVCISTGKEQEAIELVKHVVRNNHDDKVIIQSVEHFLQKSGLDQTNKELVSQAQSEVLELNNSGVKLALDGKLEESIELFTQAAKGMPENKSINLNAAQSIIMYMQKFGPTNRQIDLADSFLQRVRNIDAGDEKLGKLVGVFNKLNNK